MTRNHAYLESILDIIYLTKQGDSSFVPVRDRPVLSPASEKVACGWPKDNAWGHVAASNEQVLKVEVKPPRFSEHFFKEANQRFASVGWGGLAKRYLSGEVYLGIGFYWRDASHGAQIRKDYAIIQVARSAVENPGSPELEAIDAAKVATGTNSNQLHVLVDVRHTKNGAENLVPSIVSVASEDGLPQVGIKPQQAATHTGGLTALIFSDVDAFSTKVFPAVSSGELNGFDSCRAAAESREGDGSLIKGRSQLVDHLSCQDVQDFRGARIKHDFRQFVTRLRFCVEDDPPRVSLKEIPLGAFQLDEMVLCSL